MPKSQHAQWLERQQKKLLPIEYFMVTFTLPYELRALTKRKPKLVYALLFECAVATLMSFGLNDQALAAELATTIVLHTHSRDLNYHPHVHMIVPGGGVTKKRREWVTVKGEYLFNGNFLASVFRGKLTWSSCCLHCGTRTSTFHQRPKSGWRNVNMSVEACRRCNTYRDIFIAV